MTVPSTDPAADPVISADWLAEQLENPDLRVVDGSWYLPGEERDAVAEFEAGHIPGAVYFDIDRIADTSSPLPHMLPDAAQFAAAAGGLGLANDNVIVVYDGMGLFSAARVWWMLSVFGARRVRVLDGGLPAWKAAGGALQSGPAQPQPATFFATLDKAAVCGLDDVQAVLRTGAASVVDARSSSRFDGSMPEPRPGCRSGHMPGARSLPFTEVLDAEKRLRNPAEILSHFAEAGVDLTRPVVTSCGSGVTAAVLNLALARAGKHDVAIYDGSWAEWGTSQNTQIATGGADD